MYLPPPQVPEGGHAAAQTKEEDVAAVDSVGPLGQPPVGFGYGNLLALPGCRDLGPRVRRDGHSPGVQEEELLV